MLLHLVSVHSRSEEEGGNDDRTKPATLLISEAAATARTRISFLTGKNSEAATALPKISPAVLWTKIRMVPMDDEEK